MPDDSTLCRRQTPLSVAIARRPSMGALHLLIDSTGIKAEGDGEWGAKKHGPSKPRQWRRVHLGIDAETLDIRVAKITGAGVGDAPMLPELPAQISDDRPIGKVRADGAHDTRAGHEAIATRNAIAVIPTRRNGRPRKEATPGAQARNDILRVTRRLGRTIWRRWSGSHRRRLAETKMHCCKLLGDRLRSRDFARQRAELHIRAAILNRFTASHPPSRSAWDDTVQPQGKLNLRPTCPTEPWNSQARSIIPPKRVCGLRTSA